MIRKTAALLILVLSACLVLAEDQKAGQDDEAALLEELEEALNEDEIAASSDGDAAAESIPSQFFSNFSGSYSLRYIYFFEDLEIQPTGILQPDQRNHLFQHKVDFATFLAGELFRFDLAGWLQFGNQPAYTSRLAELESWEWRDFFQDRDPRKNFLQTTELYLSLFTPGFELSLGRKILINSLSTLYCPADLYVVRDLHDPLHPDEIGRLQLQLGIYLGNLLLTAAVFPVYETAKVDPLSRWGYDSVEAALFLDQPVLDAAVYPEITFGNMSYLLRLKGPLGGWDLFLSLFHGLSGNLVSKKIALDKESEIVPVFQAGTGFATTFDSLELHGEALFNYAYEGKDDAYLRYVFGLVFTIDEWLENTCIDKIELTTEYAGEWLIRGQKHPDYTDSTRDRRLFQNDILQQILVTMNEKLSAAVTVQYELDHIGFIFGTGLEWSIFDDFDLQVGFEIFRVPEDSSFFAWEDNTRLLSALTYSY